MNLKKKHENPVSETMILNAMQELFCFYRTPELLIDWTNVASGKSVGKSHNELIGKHCYEVWHQRNEHCNNCPVIETFNTLKPSQRRFSTPDGRCYDIHAYPVILEGELEGVIEFGMDITAEVKKEEALLKSEAKYRNLFNAANDAVFVVNARTGLIIDVNNKAVELLGREQEEIIGMHQTALHPPEQFERASGSFKDTVKNIDNRLLFKELEIINVNGERVPVEISPCKIEIDGELCILGIFRDISERKKNDEALNKAKLEAEESNRVKDAFLRNMSHEIRTPLNGILGFSELLLKPDIDEQRRIHYVQTVIRSGKQLLSILTDILEIASAERGELYPDINELELNDMLEDLYAFLQLQVSEKPIMPDLQLGLNNKQSRILSDRSILYRVLTILINNALKFTEKGFIRFGYVEENGYLHFFVKDTGPGIPVELHEKVFESFRQVEMDMTRQHGGAGLGLSISKKLVELLGGNIWLESCKGAGTAFHFTIPYCPVLTEQFETVIKSVIEGDMEPLNVLVVEDEEINYMYLKELMIDYNIRFIHVVDGNSAIEICKTNENIDLVLMDIRLPGMSGYDATKRIKSFRPNLPVIAQTAYALAGDRERAFDAQCDGYLSKPIKKDALLGVLKQYGKYKK